jgi:hypothetical protein
MERAKARRMTARLSVFGVKKRAFGLFSRRFRVVHFSCRPCENSRLGRKRARSERIFAIGRLLFAQNGRKYNENRIGQHGVRVFAQPA